MLLRQGLYSLEQRQTRKDLIETFKILREKTKVDHTTYSCWQPLSGRMGQPYKLLKQHTVEIILEKTSSPIGKLL